MELEILNQIQRLRCGVLDVAMPLFSWTANHGEIWILLAVILLARKTQRRHGAAVGCALVLDVIACNVLFKPLFGRLRPCVVNPAVELLVEMPTSPSFPSGHTAASFAAVFALKASGSPLWKPALVVASIIAFSRMYLYVHWPSDILGGILLGWAVGWGGAAIAKRIMERTEKKAGR